MVRKVTALAAFAAATALAATACSSSGTSNAVGASASAAVSAAASSVASARTSLGAQASAAVSSRHASASASRSPSGSASASAAVAACRTDQLKAAAQLQQQGSTLTLLILTNSSTGPCGVYGWPGLGYTDPSGAAQDPGSTRVAVPGGPVHTTVAPGQSAFAGLKFTTGASCPTMNELLVTPPNQRTQLHTAFTDVNGKPVTQLLRVCGKFTVGTLQPASQGVLVGL